jgi:hypothetical protein
MTSVLNLEILLCGILFYGLSILWPVLKLVWPVELWRELSSSISVTLSIILHELLIVQYSDKGCWISSPDLSSWDETSCSHNWVCKDNASSLKSCSLLDYAILSYNYIVVNDTRVDIAVSINCHVLANVAWGSDSVGKRMICINGAAISNRSKVPDSYWVKFSSNSNTVPDSCILGEEHISDKRCVWSNPSVLDLRNLIIERKHLSMSWKISSISNIVLKSWSKTIHV